MQFKLLISTIHINNLSNIKMVCVQIYLRETVYICHYTNKLDINKIFLEKRYVTQILGNKKQQKLITLRYLTVQNFNDEKICKTRDGKIFNSPDPRSQLLIHLSLQFSSVLKLLSLRWHPPQQNCSHVFVFELQQKRGILALQGPTFFGCRQTLSSVSVSRTTE